MHDPDRKPLLFHILRPGDQPMVMGMLGCALVLLAVLFVKHGGHRGELVDIDRVPPLVAKYQVDANRADWPELVQLPGVGTIMAQKWIAERERRGPFRDVDDLTRIDGVGPRTLERLRPYIAPIMKDEAVATR